MTQTPILQQSIMHKETSKLTEKMYSCCIHPVMYHIDCEEHLSEIFTIQIPRYGINPLRMPKGSREGHRHVLNGRSQVQSGRPSGRVIYMFLKEGAKANWGDLLGPMQTSVTSIELRQSHILISASSCLDKGWRH